MPLQQPYASWSYNTIAASWFFPDTFPLVKWISMLMCFNSDVKCSSVLYTILVSWWSVWVSFHLRFGPKSAIFLLFFYQASVISPLSLGDLFIFVCSFLIIWNFQRWRNWISRGNNQRVICKQEFVTRYDRGLIHISDKAIFEIFHVDNIHHFNLLQNAPH